MYVCMCACLHLQHSGEHRDIDMVNTVHELWALPLGLGGTAMRRNDLNTRTRWRVTAWLERMLKKHEQRWWLDVHVLRPFRSPVERTVVVAPYDFLCILSDYGRSTRLISLVFYDVNIVVPQDVPVICAFVARFLPAFRTAF